MTDLLLKNIEHFEENYDENELEAVKNLQQEFLTRFPRTHIPNMTLEEYALGKTQTGSLSWWLEYHTIPLGSIKGGSAVKHIIYYSRKDGDWKFPSGWNSVNEVWQKLRTDMVDLLSLYDNDPNIEMDENSLLYRANMVKGKLLFLYHSNLFLPIYLLDHLQTFLAALQVPKDLWSGKGNVQCNLLLNKSIRSSCY